MPGSIVVISPHLDDAVFSCGDWLADHPGARVVTFFAGTPNPGDQSTEWDIRCGFHDAAQAMSTRRDEDRHALAALGAVPVWLDFCDGQYGEAVTPAAMARALVDSFRDDTPSQLIMPFGLFHPDHLLALRAATLAIRQMPGVPVLAYEDAIYRAMPGLLQERLADLAAAGIRATPAVDVPAQPGAAKRRAVGCYASQLAAFGPQGLLDVWRPERLWTLGTEFRHRDDNLDPYFVLEQRVGARLS